MHEHRVHPPPPPPIAIQCSFTSCVSTLRCFSNAPMSLVILLMAALVKATMKDVPKTNQVASSFACVTAVVRKIVSNTLAMSATSWVVDYSSSQAAS